MSHVLTRAEILELKRLAVISVEGKRLASIRGAAIYCGVDPRTIRRRVADGTITGYTVGKKLLRVDLNEVDSKLLQRIPTAG